MLSPLGCLTLSPGKCLSECSLPDGLPPDLDNNSTGRLPVSGHFFWRSMLASPDHEAKPSVLILGASTRAAAQSALRAGLSPMCADLFADRDLAHCAPVLEVAHYPHGLVVVAAAAPPAPWLYTGGLENHPRIVEEISLARTLWGNAGDVLRQVRDPWHVADLLAAQGLPACRVWPRARPAPGADGNWMLKPLRGAAGRGIRIWDVRGSECATHHEPHYYQERRAGAPVSAVFLAVPRRTILLGITRQLVGMPEVHAPPFAWCGTITPIELPVESTAAIRRVGDVLSRQTRLRGLFGCDFILDHSEPWLTEVNPRYPASAELVERVLHIPLLDWHRRACESFDDSRHTFVIPDDCATRPGSFAGPVSTANHCRSVLGKIVLYARRDLTAPDAIRFVRGPSPFDESRQLDTSLPYMADIPTPGTRILRGQPICTLFARAASERECLEKLIRRAARFESRIP